MTGERKQLLDRLDEYVGDDHEHYFRTGEVATILRVSPRAVRSWADDDLIPCKRTGGGHRLFPASGVDDALRRMEGR